MTLKTETCTILMAQIQIWYCWLWCASLKQWISLGKIPNTKNKPKTHLPFSCLIIAFLENSVSTMVLSPAWPPDLIKSQVEASACPSYLVGAKLLESSNCQSYPLETNKLLEQKKQHLRKMPAQMIQKVPRWFRNCGSYLNLIVMLKSPSDYPKR